MTGTHLIHVTGPLERWDHIAHRYYGDAGLYDPIIQANRDLFVADLSPIPAVLPPGLELRVPVIEPASRVRPEDLPPWLRAL